MDILDYLWYLIKLLGLLCLVTFLSSLFINIVNDIFSKHSQRKMSNMIDRELEEMIKNGKFEATIVPIEKNEKNKSKK